MKVVDGSKVFIRNKNKFLFVLRDDKPDIPHPNMWSLIGGAIEKGETPLQALKREVKEEITIKLRNIKLLMVIPKVPGLNVKNHIYIGETEDKLSNIELLEEGQKLAYFTLNEVLKLNAVPHMKDLIRKHRKILEA